MAGLHLGVVALAAMMAIGTLEATAFQLEGEIPCNLKRDGYGNPIKLSYGGSCTNYYDCENGQLVVKACPTGQNFDYDLRECRRMSEANCKPLEHCNSFHKEPVEDNCSYYSMCSASKKVILPCPAGKYFSRSLQDCVDKRDSDCGQNIPCSGKGKMPDPLDCTKYTQCVNGFVQTKSCGTGLHFNPFAHVCENARDAGCDTTRPCHAYFPYHVSPTTCSGNGRSPNKCNCEMYKECVNGIVVDRTCPIGKHFNKHSEECMDPSEAFCNECCGGSTTHSTPTQSTPTQTTPTTTTKKIERGCIGDKKSPDWCDCTAYKQCVNGHNVTLHCADGKHFNPIELECQHPCEARCDLSWKGCHTTPGTVKCSGNKLAPVCGDCTAYTVCINGEIVKKNCPDGLHFNPYAHTCMDPREAGCEHCDCCPEPTLPPPECNGPFNSTDKCGDCHSYRKCLDHNIVTRWCPPDMHFNPFALECQPECEAHCKEVNCPTPPPPKCKCSGNLKTPLPSSCTQYQMCVNGEIVTKSCPYGLHFNRFTGVCQTPCEACCEKDAVCPGPTPKPRGKCLGNGKKPHPTNCHAYMECSNGQIKEYLCPNELDFNPFAQECQPIEIAGCDDRETCKPECHGCELSPHECDCRLFYECHNGKKLLRTCNRKHFNPVSLKCEHPQDAGCELHYPALLVECVGDYKVPHEDVCALYYECDKGMKILKKCPVGTEFSTEAQACVYPSDPEADCQLEF